MKAIRESIKKLEGFRSKPYTCPAGKLTIGYGFNLEDTGLTEEESEAILDIRLKSIDRQLIDKYDWFEELTEARKLVVVNMVFQLGMVGFSKFKKTIEAIEDFRYKEAGMEMLDSKWAKQTPTRANYLAKLMRQGY